MKKTLGLIVVLLLIVLGVWICRARIYWNDRFAILLPVKIEVQKEMDLDVTNFNKVNEFVHQPLFSLREYSLEKNDEEIVSLVPQNISTPQSITEIYIDGRTIKKIQYTGIDLKQFYAEQSDPLSWPIYGYILQTKNHKLFFLVNTINSLEQADRWFESNILNGMWLW